MNTKRKNGAVVLVIVLVVGLAFGAVLLVGAAWVLGTQVIAEEPMVVVEATPMPTEIVVVESTPLPTIVVEPPVEPTVAPTEAPEVLETPEVPPTREYAPELPPGMAPIIEGTPLIIESAEDNRDAQVLVVKLSYEEDLEDTPDVWECPDDTLSRCTTEIVAREFDVSVGYQWSVWVPHGSPHNPVSLYVIYEGEAKAACTFVFPEWELLGNCMWRADVE